MRRAFLLAALVVVFAPSVTAASVNLTDVTVSPSDTLWMDEEFRIKATCQVNGSDPTVQVTEITQTTDEDVSHIQDQNDNLLFQDPSDTPDDVYVLWGSALFDFLADDAVPGRYNLSVRCSAGDASDSATTSLSLQNLTLTVADGPDGTLYPGDKATAELRLVVDRLGTDGVPTEDVTLAYWKDGSWIRPDAPSFGKGTGTWELQVDVPDPDTSELRFRATYDNVTAQASTPVDIDELVSFDVSASPLEVGAGDTVALEVGATHRGDPIAVGKDDITVRVDGSTVSGVIEEEVVTDGPSRFTFPAPELNPGAYPLRVDLDAYSAVATRMLRYPIPVEGRFLDRNGQGVRHTLRFRDGQRTVLDISGRGDYAGSILPGTYDVAAVFENGRAEAVFSGVEVDAWDDPIRYARYEGGVPGLKTGGVFAFRTSLAFDTVDLTLAYDEAAVANPDTLSVYRCDNWDMGRKTCYTEWTEVAAEFDDVQAEVRVETGTISSRTAYAIGRRDGLRVLHGHETETYLPDGTVSFGGMVQDGDGNPVRNASVTLEIAPGGVERTVATDGQGRYAFTVPAPDAAGTYTAELTAGREPYAEGSARFSFGVERPPRLEVTAPDGVMLRQNGSKGVDVFVRNTGYTVIDDIQADTDDIPLLERVTYNGDPLERNESRRATLVLAAGPNATPETHTARLRFVYAGEAVEHVFGVTVEEAPEAVEARSSLTGNLPLSGASAALVDVAPGGVPVTTVVFVVLLLQGGIVAFFFLRTRVGVDRPVIGTLRTARDDMPASSFFGGGEPERENVLRAVDHIKEELER